MARLSGERTSAADLGGPALLLELVSAQKQGEVRGVFSVCSAHPVVLRCALEQALEDNTSVLVESTSNQVNQEGGYTGIRPAEFAAFMGRLAAEAGLPRERVVLGGDHLGPHPWRAEGATIAMERAVEMVRQYVRAGYAKIHLDASMTCAGDPPGPLDDSVVAARAADLAAAAEAASSGRRPPVYVVGTEVPPPGGQAGGHAGPAVTRPSDAERTLRALREAFARRGLERAWERVVALVVQPGVEFGDDVVFAYRPEEAAGLKALVEAQDRLVYEAHSTDYQAEGSLRALVADHHAILKVGPELTFAFREAVFSLEEIERELLGHRTPERLSGLRAALDGAMRRDPRHWEAFYVGDEDEQRLRRAWSLSDRARYYWARPEVAAALERLFANLGARSLPQGLMSQYLPGAVDLARETPARDLPGRAARLHVRRVLQRYARACRPGVSDGRESP
jgi:D-tagatose-1,6-bisphosphate aldolase subunit GatZ/KbaZ